MKSFHSIHHIKQPKDSALCGAACISMVFDYLGIEIPKISDIWSHIVSKSPIGRHYCKTNKMGIYLAQKGVNSTIVRYQDLQNTLTYCEENRIPVIMNHHSFADIRAGHFTLLKGIKGRNGHVELFDPEKDSPSKVNLKHLQEYFLPLNANDEITGRVLILCDSNKKTDRRVVNCPRCKASVDITLFIRLKASKDLEAVLCQNCDSFF